VLSPPIAASKSVGGVRSWMAPLLVAFGAVAIVRAVGEMQAMAIYNGASRLSTVERAAFYDPGSYRIQMRLADGYAGRGECGKSVPHARRANGMYPNASAPKAALRKCGVRLGK
jgi:hypothetical protein